MIQNTSALRSCADTPTHGNVIVYTGVDVDAFERVFARFGVVRR